MSKRSFQVSIDFLGNISDLQNKIKTLSGDLSKIGATSGGVNVQKQFDQLAQSLQNLQTKAKQPITSQGEFNKLMQEVNKVEGSYNNLLATLEGLYNLSNSKKLELLPKEEQQRIRQAAQAIETFEKNTKSASSSIKELKNAQDKANTALDNQAAAQKTFKSLTAQAAAAEKEYKDLATAANNLADAQEKYNNLFYKTGKRAGQQKDNISNEQVAEATAKLTEAKAKADMLRGAYDNIGTAAAEAGKRAQALSNLKIKASQELTKAQEAANRLGKELEDLKTKFEASSGQQLQQSFEQLKNKAKELGISLEGIGDKATTSGIDLLKQRLQSLETQGLEKVDQGIVKTIATTQGGLLPALQNVRIEADKSRESFDGFTRAMNDVEGLKSRIGYFFSMTNSVMLLRRALTSALNTVKELDAVMTETAVVTDFTVGDMWEKLPEYASHANALGASIKDLYSATTLYYQQGLQTEAAMGVGIETMKMARIAGMEAADATEAMTAALRGFNMEVNETNAVRVNDVYSELAAITAADTQQIATAMSKTASIAASANMEFETTAALLAQIIETTQEAPETAGTALKTIIARFSEVKKLREEGANTGEDEEGEAIDVNKIQGALRTVGISMDDFFAGTEGLDSILLKLAEKWKDLDFETQRYIATTAAGSRQQSRFIAMMSDYERTMELATAANNSAGASQQQFDKTLESMEAKLQKLKNAWNEFTMGLANNEILKLGVDLLTGLLNTINKVTSSLSGGNGLVKSIINLATVIGALKGGASIFRGVFGESGLLKNKSTGLLTSIIGKDSTSKAAAQGQKDGIAYANGFKRAVQTKKTGAGIGQQFGALIGKEAAVSIGNMTEEQLDESISKLKTRTLNSIGKNTSTGVSWKSYSVQDITTDQAAELKNTLKDFDAGKITYDEADAACQKYGTSMKELTQMIKTTTLDFTSMGMAAVGAGTAISLLGNLFDKLGLEGLGEGFKTAGSILTGFGSIAMMLGPIMTKLGISFTTAGVALNGALVAPMASILAIAGPVVIALGALVAILWAIHEASPEVQLQKAQEAAAQAGEAANAAAEAYDNLKSSLESIEGKETALEELAVGTLEWKEAVSELNNEILDLVSKYPELSQFVSSTDGILSISDKGAQKVLENQYKVQENTQAAKAAAQIRVQNAQQNVDFADLDNKLKLTKMVDTYGYYGSSTQTEMIDRAATEQLAKQLASGEISTNDASLDFLKNVEGGYDEFLEYGRALLASEQAIEIFTDSLLNAATVNAEIPQDLKDEVAGAFDTQSIDKLISIEGVNLGTINKADKEAYAEAMGYTHVSGNKYKDASGNEIKVSNNDVREQLAAINAQAALTDKVTQLGKVIGKLSDSTNSLDKAFVNMASKADGAGLTLDDITNLEGKFDGSYSDSIKRDEYTGEFIEFSDESLQALYSQVEHLYSSPEEFYRIFSEAYSQAEERKASSEEKLTHMGMEGAFQDAKIDTGALAGITDNLYDVFLASGPDAAQALAGSIEETLNTIEDPEQAQIFANALNAINWQNFDDVEELDTILAGMDFDYAVDGLDELKQEIITAAKATRQFSLEKVREEIKSAQDLKKDLKDRENTERSFTAEERDILVKANPELASQFVISGIDEFIYVGNSMIDLIAALDRNTSALIGEYGEQLKANAERSALWESKEGQGNWTGGGLEDETNTIQVFEKIIGGTLTNVNREALISVMTEFGMAEGRGDLNNFDFEALKAIIAEDYSKYYGAGGNVAESNQNQYNEWQDNEEQLKYTNSNAIALQQSLNKEYKEYNPVTNKTDTTVVDQKANETDTKKYVDALRAQATQLGVNQTAIDKFNKALEDNGGVLDDNTAAILSNAIADKQATARLSKTMDAVKDITDEYEDFNNILDSDVQTIGESLGLDDMEVGSDNFAFIKDNLSLIEKAINGDTAAMTEFQNLLAQQQGLTIDATTGFVDMSALTEATGQVEQSAIAAMNALIEAGAFEIETVKVDESGEYDVPIIDPATGLISGFEKKRFEAGQTYQVVKPIDAPQVREASGNRGGASGGGGGGGGGGSKTKWENPYDEFYNTVEKINEELRTREKLERRYQNLLNKTDTKASDLVKNAQKQLESLQAEKKLHEELLNGRKRQMSDVENENKDLQKYARYNEETGTIEIDWEKINALDGSKNEKLTSRIEDYIKELEERQSQIEEEEDALADIEEAIWEIYNQGKDEYFDLEQKIKDALVNQRQEEIDKLSAINDSINDTNTRLIDAMQSSIDKYRQDRENERTEEELSDKQRRLAYLQQDTSGANALEIMQLQEEIDQGMEDYTDQLIDQKINELQEQNDKAAEQREKQIAIAEAQLKKWEESGEIWNDVYELMGSGIDENGIIIGSDLYQLLAQNEDYPSMSNLEKLKWAEELVDQVAQAVQWLAVGNSTEALIKKGELSSGQQITFTTKDGDEVTGTLKDNGDVVDSQGNTYTGVYRDQEGNWVTEEETKKVENEGGTSTGGTGNEEDTSNQQQTKYPYGKASEVSGEVKYGDKGKKVKAIQWALKKLGYSVGNSGIDGIFGNDTLKAVKKFQRNSKISVDGIVGKNTKKAFKLKQYASGGLADFTGPAWLDGTKSKPEYILNAEQTKSFFKLVDILSGLKSGANQSSQITGDSIYDVDINVESIGNDYDVEKLATTIKRMINDDARYRNNNAINLQR